MSQSRVVCLHCRGTGKVFKAEVFSYGWKQCPACKGKGYVEYKPQPQPFNPYGIRQRR